MGRTRIYRQEEGTWERAGWIFGAERSGSGITGSFTNGYSREESLTEGECGRGCWR